LPELISLAFARGLETDYFESLGIRSDAKSGDSNGAVESTSGPTVYGPPGDTVLQSISQAEREIDLTIRMLGPIEVFRGQSRELGQGAWTLSRALRILCFIASRHNHRATKDSIVETFWPDTRPEDIDKNFWPTISYIRRALNSNQDVRKNFIRYREGAYYLNPEFQYSFDCEEFEKLITLSQRHRSEGNSAAFAAAARSAVELYRGEFLEEVYDRWVEEPRAYFQSQYFTALKELADHHHRAAEFEQSILYCRMILNRDAYREDIHRQLMDSYARVGNRAALREQYETLKALLSEELGVDPLPETVATYSKLMSD